MKRGQFLIKREDEDLPAHFRLILGVVRQADRDVAGLGRCSLDEKREAKIFLQDFRGDDERR